MPSRNELILPMWNEAHSIRETTLQYIDDPVDRFAARRFGQLLFDLAVETSRENAGEASATRANLRAAAEDLRYLEGYLGNLGRTLEHASVKQGEEVLVWLAGRLALRVGDMVAEIEERL
jgi:hypothetical protein